MFVQRTQVLKISLFAILSAFAVELVFGLVFNSLGLITDSVHALLDSVVTVVLLLAARNIRWIVWRNCNFINCSVFYF